MGKPVVTFVCTHNACRSQIAEAMARRFADDVMLARSAGTHPAKNVNPDAARLLASEYEFDVASLEPKSLTCLPDVDILITMGCGVECPSLPAMYREDWGLEDPTGKGDDAPMSTSSSPWGAALNAPPYRRCTVRTGGWKIQPAKATMRSSARCAPSSNASSDSEPASGLEDPTGKGDDAFLRTMRAIQQRVIGLRARIVAGEFDRERLASNLKALGDPNRLRIVELPRHRTPSPHRGRRVRPRAARIEPQGTGRPQPAPHRRAAMGRRGAVRLQPPLGARDLAAHALPSQGGAPRCGDRPCPQGRPLDALPARPRCPRCNRRAARTEHRIPRMGGSSSELEISQPTLSHHMAALRDAGIVRARKDGRWMHYQLDHDVLDAIAALLGQSIAYRAWEDPEE